jgi:PAS domain S-box-containing protein
MAAHEEIRYRERLFRRLAESLPNSVLEIDQDRRVVYANARLGAILGVTGAATLTEQLTSLTEPDQDRLYEATDAALAHGSDHELEVELRLPATGEPRRCAAAVVALTGAEGTPGALLSLSDITDSARSG